MSSVKPDWLEDPDILPYVCIRKENHIIGIKKHFSWFDREPYIVDPLSPENLSFVKLQMKVDSVMFGKLFTPKWAFYNCGIMPGLITGFAMRRDKIPQEIQHVYESEQEQEWVPLSLFVVIPCVGVGQWAAHNLCSLNELFPKGKKLRGLGFLSKAFGLWYASIDWLYGVTQWNSHALKLHANFGDFELISSYNPFHNFPCSLTYRCRVDSMSWKNFFDKSKDHKSFHLRYQKTKLMIDPSSEKNLKSLQSRLEKREGPFFLSGAEILEKPLGSPLTLFTSLSY